MTRLFIEQPLALPGSAKKIIVIGTYSGVDTNIARSRKAALRNLIGFGGVKLFLLKNVTTTTVTTGIVTNVTRTTVTLTTVTVSTDTTVTITTVTTVTITTVLSCVII